MKEEDPELGKRVHALIQQAQQAAESGNTATALAALRSGLQLAPDIASPSIRAPLLRELGLVGFRLNVHEETEQAFQLVLACPRDKVADDVWGSTQLSLGLLYSATGRFDDGVVQLSAAGELAAKHGAVNLTEIALRKLGECYFNLENYPRALTAFLAALPLAEQLGNLENKSSLLQSLAYCSLRLNQLEDAQRYHEDRLTLAQEQNDSVNVAGALGDLGNVHLLLGHYHRALDCFARARPYFAGQEATLNYLDARSVQAIGSIADQLAAYVSRSIAQSLSNDQGAKEQEPTPEYPGVFKDDVMFGLLALAEEVPQIKPLVSQIGINEVSHTNTADLLKLVGEVTRHISDRACPDPADLFDAARYLMQIRRSQRALGLLDRIRRGDLEPDFSGTGHGGYLLYLRSFVGASMMPQYRIEPWGEVDLEEILASKLAQGPYPLIALGNPEVESFGAGKIQTTDATWKNDLTLLGKHADLIVVVPCATEGTSWEIEWVVINKFLRKTVFVMPPSSKDSQHWWKEKWVELQRWCRYLRLAFPDYEPAGQFFTLGPGGQLGSKDYESVLSESSLWDTFVLGILGQFIASTEWLLPVRDAMPAVLLMNKSETAIQEGVEQHVSRITERIHEKGPKLLDKVSPYLLGMLENGLPPRGEFDDWPPESGRIPSGPGLYTIWEGPYLLIWVGVSENLFDTLDSFANGTIEKDGFCAAVLKQRVMPYLDADLKREVEQGLLPLDKMVRFRIRRDFLYRLLPMGIADAQLFEYLIRRGVLDAGAPQLQEDATLKRATQ